MTTYRIQIILCVVAMVCGASTAVAGGLGVMGKYNQASLVFGVVFFVFEAMMLVRTIVVHRLRRIQRELDQIGWPD